MITDDPEETTEAKFMFLHKSLSLLIFPIVHNPKECSWSTSSGISDLNKKECLWENKNKPTDFPSTCITYCSLPGDPRLERSA